MQKYFYKLRFQLDQTAFRAQAKRQLAFQLWERFCNKKNRDFKVLDYGCGTGLLQDEFEEKFEKSIVYGIDVSDEAIKFCRKRGLKRVKLYNGKKIPFPDKTFHSLFSIDVLEHTPDDVKSLQEIKRVLKPGGIAVLLVPSHQHLWSTRDIRLQHFRRYEQGELAFKCKSQGLKILTNKNVDFLPYFVLKLMCLRAPKKKGIPDLKRDDEQFTKILDRLFYFYESLENKCQEFITFPIGISQVVVVKKVNSGETEHRGF